MAKEYRSFSERQGFTTRPSIQLGNMDRNLINDIWNFVWENFFLGVPSIVYESQQSALVLGYLGNPNLKHEENFRAMWTGFFHADISAFAEGVSHDKLRTEFDFLLWTEKYDYLEWAIRFLSHHNDIERLTAKANEEVLEPNNSGYRFVRGLLVPIIGKIEINNLNNGATSGIEADHIEKALAELNKRKNRDTTHIAVEAINGVESALKTYLVAKLPDDKSITNKTLKPLLNKLESSNLLTSHTAYMTSIDKLYGYLSQVGRHGQASSDASKTEMSLAEATYILEVCSAFVNYLKADMQDSQKQTKHDH